jgi:hypothetical protein
LQRAGLAGRAQGRGAQDRRGGAVAQHRDPSQPPFNVRFQGSCGRPRLSLRLSAFDPGCVKTVTSKKCRKYNSPTRLRAVGAQYDLTPLMRNFADVLLRVDRALEFLHGQDPKRTSARTNDVQIHAA